MTLNKKECRQCFYLKLAPLPRGLVTLSICRHLRKTHCLVFPYLFTYFLDRKAKVVFRVTGPLCFFAWLALAPTMPPNFGFSRIRQEKKDHNAHMQQKFNIIKGTSIINIKNKLRAHLTLQKYLSLGPQHHNFPERWHQCWAWSICISLGQLAGCF